MRQLLQSDLFDVNSTKQQTVIESIKDAFEGENMQTEYYQSGYRIDLYFHDYRLAIELDEFGHCDRDIEYEKERKKILKKELNCVFIRINLDKEDFTCFKDIMKYVGTQINRLEKRLKKKLKSP